jgi:hypothetical protein
MSHIFNEFELGRERLEEADKSIKARRSFSSLGILCTLPAADGFQQGWAPCRQADTQLVVAECYR